MGAKGGGRALKGIVVKKVPPDYEMSDEEAETIEELTKKGYIVILDRRPK